MKLQTLGRWIVPATILSLAVAAIVFLGALELSETDEVYAPASAQAQQAALRAEPPRLRVAPPPPAERAAAPAPAPIAPRKASITQPASYRRPQPGAARQETEASRKAATLTVRLARLDDLGERLRLLDRELAKMSSARALLELEGLLDGAEAGFSLVESGVTELGAA